MGTLAECYDAVLSASKLADESEKRTPGADMMTAKHAGIDPVAHW